MFEQRLWVGELGDLPARGTFAAEVIGEPLAVGGLSKQPRESELPDAARSGEEESMRDPGMAERASQCSDNFFIAQELGKTHSSTFVDGVQNGVDREEHFPSYIFGEPQGIAASIVALNGSPRLAAREHVIHFGGVFEVMQAFLLNVVFLACVVSLGFLRHQFLSLARGNPQIQDQVFPRQPINGILEMFYPTKEFRPLLGIGASNLVGQVRRDISIYQDNLAFLQGRFNAWLRLKAIARIEERGEVRVHGLEGAEIAVKKPSDHVAKPGVVLRKAGGEDGVTADDERLLEKLCLSVFSATVDSFDGNEQSACRHEVPRWRWEPLAVASVTGDCRGCNQRRTRRNRRLACYDFAVVNAKMLQTTIPENLSRVRERIATAARRAGRKPEEITLVGVSKTHPAEVIQTAFDAGLRHFGENRVQEWEAKRSGIAGLQATWHLIGHLQSNKAARAAHLFSTVDSIDDFALATKLDRACSDLPEGVRLRVLLEVQLGGEQTKSGVAELDLPELAEKVDRLPRLELAGLMCIPPFLAEPERVRPYFSRLRELHEQVAGRLGRRLPVLSMGMSHDFEVAILEGSTEVRVGTALFGARMTLG